MAVLEYTGKTIRERGTNKNERKLKMKLSEAQTMVSFSDQYYLFPILLKFLFLTK